ncbi:MAG: glycosyl hydrolase family 17 [Gammaproteobacteria bacterium]|nr:glycosyl hydrolase family 17 [Gammaproteobacteria bacterium]MBT8133176.1 glycosyl hydrolase family 17 [Gammaproteobacteria bacterium]NNJ50843.1 glycosyl hydrolase family 17 [Gammaproteobacteria bacterium]
MISNIRLVSIAILVFLVACSSAAAQETNVSLVNDSFSKRKFNPSIDGNWIGNGISYGAYRDGEGPGKGLTSKQNILEDLQIIATRWNLIRLYGSDQQSQNILEVIAENDLPIRVMQGIWLDGHKSDDENTAQLERAIELAKRFPEIIVAVNVGNEIFVDWSYHRLDDMDKVITQIRQVRASVAQPVTVSDDYNFWNKPQAKKIADEIDFICLHAYAFWNNKTLDVAMDWTDSIYRDIQSRHPEHRIAYCETGWPTSRIYNDGSYEGGLIGKAGEKEQAVFFDQYDSWVEGNRVISFYFSSFDEQWKGGFDGENPMDKAEKHWGLYKSDRSPKKALR